MQPKKPQKTSKHFSLRTAARKQFQLFFHLWYMLLIPSGLPQPELSTEAPGVKGDPCTECLCQVAKGTFHPALPLRRGVPILWFSREFLYTRCILITFTICWYLCYIFHLIHGTQVCKYHSYCSCGSYRTDSSLIS